MLELQNEVLELHGSTHDVKCMKCGHLSDRKRMQRQLADLNPRLAAAADAAVKERMGEAPYDDGVTPREENTLKTRPDGDVELDGEAVVDFIVPPCRECGGWPLKPAVVFFGDSVPRDVALAAKGAAQRRQGEPVSTPQPETASPALPGYTQQVSNVSCGGRAGATLWLLL